MIQGYIFGDIMTKSLLELIKIYSTGSHIDFSTHLIGQSKDMLVALLSELLTVYINDKNSSTIREILSVTLAGYEHNSEKIGFNGFRYDGFGKPINCEAKPKNILSNGNKKLNGGGNFTDYTWQRFERDKKSDLNLIISGFVDGRMIYLMEFPFNHSSFLDRLYQVLLKRFPEREDIKGQYLRSATFTFNHYKDADIRVIYIVNDLINYKSYIEKNLFNFLNGVKC